MKKFLMIILIWGLSLYAMEEGGRTGDLERVLNDVSGELKRKHPEREYSVTRAPDGKLLWEWKPFFPRYLAWMPKVLKIGIPVLLGLALLDCLISFREGKKKESPE